MKKIFRILTNGYFDTFNDFYRSLAVGIVLAALLITFSFCLGWQQGIPAAIMLTIGLDQSAGIGRVSPFDSRPKKTH